VSVHPEHARLVGEVRGWCTTPEPRIGHRVERRRFGYYYRIVEDRTNRVTVENLSPSDVPGFLEDVRGYFGGQPVQIYVDDIEADRALDRFLIAAGCVRGPAMVYLAHVGEVPTAPVVQGMRTDPVTETNLREFIATRLRGFRDSEAEPPAGEVDEEAARRLAAMAAGSLFCIARLDSTTAAVLGWRDGKDRFGFQLATRTPFRGRGIATALLCRVLTDAYRGGCASVIINTDPAGLAIRLYRRLGFVDEVYWRRRYVLEG